MSVYFVFASVYALFSFIIPPKKATDIMRIMNKLWISAGLTATKDKSSQQIKEAITLLQSQTIQEVGCIRFEVLQHKDEPNKFTLWEEWENEAALQIHYDAPHTQAYFAQDLTEVTYIEKLEGIA